MKNALMLALLFSGPVAVQAMEPAAAPVDDLKTLEGANAPENDPLEQLKALFGAKTDLEAANHVRRYVDGLESLDQNDLIGSLKFLSQHGKLAEVHKVVAPKRTVSGDGAGQDANAADTKISALQAAVAILQGVVGVVTDQKNQLAVQQAQEDLAKAGCKNCSIL